MSRRPPRARNGQIVRSDARTIGAIVAATDGAGRVLVVRQRAGPGKGEWLLPGGGVEDGEDPEDAANRELREETGCELEHIAYVASYTVAWPNESWTGTVHLFRGVARGVLSPEAGSEVRWIETDAADAHPTLRRALVDAGLRADDERTVAEALRAAGFTFERVAVPAPIGREGGSDPRDERPAALDEALRRIDALREQGLLDADEHARATKKVLGLHQP